MSQEKPIYTVSQITSKIKILLESSFDSISVMGEVSNFRTYQSGHWYFSLKDENAQISCVMWRGFNSSAFFIPKDGMKIIVFGRINVYEPRGYYQVEVYYIKPLGVGELQIAFEELKRKLAQEGLFDAKYKKPIPKIPMRIGVVTSKDGAVFYDVLAVIKRRFPVVQVVLAHVSVQGAKAPYEIAEALDLMNEYGEVDVIILCRGGGSIEDLWAFNEEITARAIFRSKIPIVTGIGHEVDFTIADFVADFRAATPTEAAEIVTPDFSEVINFLKNYDELLYKLIEKKLIDWKTRLYNEIRSYSFVMTESLINTKKQSMDFTLFRLNQACDRIVLEKKNKILSIDKVLNLSNHVHTLSKGYTIVRQLSKVVERKNKFISGVETEIEFYDGKVIING